MGGKCDDFLSFHQSVVQLIGGKTVPAGIAVIENKSRAEAINVNQGAFQIILGKGQIEFHDPIVVDNHALHIKGYTLRALGAV